MKFLLLKLRGGGGPYLSSKEGLKKGGGKGEKEGGGEGEKEKEKGRIHGNDILLGRHQSSQCDPVNE